MCWMLLLVAMVSPMAVADVVDVEERNMVTIGGYDLMVKKVGVNGGEGYCKIKADKVKEEMIKVGRTRKLGALHVQVVSVQENICRMIVHPVAEGSYEIVDMLSMPKEKGKGEEKKYSLSSEEFWLRVVNEGNEKVSFVKRDMGDGEETSDVIKSGRLFTFSDGLELSVLQVKQGGAKFGLVKGSDTIIMETLIEDDFEQEDVVSEVDEAEDSESQLVRWVNVEEERKKEREKPVAAEVKREEQVKEETVGSDADGCDPGFCYANSNFDGCPR